MANKVIKGLTVEISGDTTKLGQALDSADKQSRALSAELRQIDKLLQFDEANPELLAQKQKVLTDQITQTAGKLNLLKTAQEQAAEAFKRGEVSEEQMRALEREVISAESALKRYEAAADETAQKISEIGESTESAANAGKALSETVKEQEKELSALKTQYADVAAAEGVDSDAAKALGAQITTLSDELSANQKALNDAAKAADAYDNTLAASGNSLADTVKVQQNGLKKLRSEYVEAAASKGKDSDEAKALAQQISALSGELAENQGKLKDAEKQADSFDKSLQNARDGSKTLKDTISDQKSELAKLKDSYAESVAAKGKDAEESKQLAAQITALSGELKANEQRLSDAESAADDLDGTIENLGDDEKDTEKDTSALGEALKNGIVSGAKAAVDALAAVTAAAAATVAGIVSATGEAAEYGDNIDKMSQKLGMSAEAYQEWDAIMQHSGSDIDKMSTSMKKLAEAVQSPTDKTAAAFDRLGISLSDAAKMSQEELFSATITALQKMESGTERTAVASTILGKSAMDLGALLNTSAEDTEKMRQQVHALGGVMSDDAVKASAKYQDSLQDMKTAIGGVTRSIGTSFMPSITQLMDGFSALFTGDDSGIETMKNGMENFVEVIGQTAAKAAETAEKYLPQILPELVGSLTDMIPDLLNVLTSVLDQLITSLANNLPELAQSILNAIVNLAPALASTLLNVAAELTKTLVSMAPDILRTLMRVAASIVSELGEILPGLIDTLVSDVIPSLITNFFAYLPDVIGAVADAVSAIAAALPDIIQKLVDYLPEIIDTIIYGISQSVPKIIEALKNAVKAIAKAIPSLLKALPDVVKMVFSGIMEMIPEILDGIMEVIDALMEELPSIIEAICEAIPAIITGIIDTLTAMLPRIIDCGIRLFTSLVEALPQIIQTICDALPTLIKGITDGILASIPQLIQCAIKLAMSIVQALPQIISVLVDAIPDIISSLVSAIAENAGDIIEGAFTIIETLVTGLFDPENLQKLLDAGGKILKKLWEGVKKVFKDLLNWFAGIGEEIGYKLADVIEEAKQWGKDLIQNFIDGCKEAWNKWEHFWEGIGEDIYDFLHHSTPEKGPLKDDDEWGADFMENFIGGAASKEDELIDTVEGIATDVEDAMQDMADTVADTEITPPEIPEFGLPDYTPVRIPVTIEPELDGIDPEFSFDGVQRSLHMNGEQTVIMAVDPEMMAKLDQILGAVQAGKEILLDGDALVGGTVGKYNTAFGEMQVLSERSVT